MSEAMEEVKEVVEEAKHTVVPENEGPLKKWIKGFLAFLGGCAVGGGLTALFMRNRDNDSTEAESESPAE